jgi:tetratricopeptide (TPR) repeat protein
LQSVTNCIEIYEALLAESDSSTGVDTSSPSPFQPGYITEARRSRTERYHLLIRLAHALRERYTHTGHEPDLDAAIARGQAALKTCSIESMLCPTVLVIYASILQKNFQRTGDDDELHRAESMCRQGLALCNTACMLSATAYNTLGWIIFRLYEGVGTPAYLDEALDMQRHALKLESASRGAEAHQYLRALAVYTIWRHKDRGDPQDIDNATSFLEQALELCPVMHIDRTPIVQSMIHAVREKYFLASRLEDLNKAINLGRQTMATANFPRGNRRLGFLNVLANLLFIRYQIALPTDCDLEESINLRREIFQHISPGSIFRWKNAENLASTLQLRFRRKGEFQDLEESVKLYRHAIDLLPEDHPERPGLVSSLSEDLCYRYHETWDAADLDEALVLGRYAMATMLPSHARYWDVSLAAISQLCIRFEVFQTANDLDQAILLSRDLLETIPHGHIYQDDTVHQLAKALLLRGTYMNARKDVDRAICELLPFRKRLAQWANASEVSRTLAASYLVRFRLNQDFRDAAHALDITNDLLDVVGPDHYERFQCLVHAAELYLEHGTPFRDVAIALKYIAEAILNNCRDVRSKIQGAKCLLDIVKSQYKDVWTTASPAIPAQLLNIYISTISLLPRVAFFGLHLHSRLQSLAMGQSIALDGASHALNISLPERSLEILEQGRVIFWNHALRLRSPVDHVPDEYRDRLAYLARQLEKSSDALRDTQDSKTIENEASQRRQQSEEFNSLLDRVRCFPGMERFLLHDEYATLAKAADRGLVVVLVSSALACHAVVVKPVDDIISIPLDSMTESWLDDSSNVWRTEVIRARSAIRDNRKMVKAVKSSRSMSTRATDILERLWTCIVYPIFNSLGLEVCCFSLHGILHPELNYDSLDSHPLAVIDHVSGGVQLAVSLTFHFTQQVLMANNARITLFRLTPPHSEVLSVSDLHSNQSRSDKSRP